MKRLFKAGDTKCHQHQVGPTDFAVFAGNTVHSVCSTFALAREMEWASRLFVLDMLEQNEEGIGTRLNVIHHSPALEEEVLEIEATWKEITKGGEILCDITVRVKDRLVASGITGQKILPKEKINQIFARLEK